MSTLATIRLLGRDWPVSPPSGPSGFTAAEEWREAVANQSETQGLRLMGAAIGLATGLGRESKETLEKHGYSMLSYGGAVHGWLRLQGATPEELLAAAPVCYRAILELVTPKEQEVKEKVGFTSDGAPST